MEQYIPKSVIVAEINRVLNSYHPTEITSGRYALASLRDFLDTLEVKEVDLEKEIYDVEKRFGDIDEMGGYRILIFDDEFRDVLHHFFELGLKAQKGE